MFSRREKIANESFAVWWVPGVKTPLEMMKPFNLTLGIALLAFSFGCTTTRNNSAVERKIEAVQEKFAPDRHLAIFKVEFEPNGSGVVLRGEVDNAAAKQELVRSVSEVSPHVIDEVTLLPDKNLGDKTFGITVVSAACSREEPSPGAELGTQVLLGNTFKIWKSKGAWSYVQSKDGYLGWMERDQFITCTSQEADSWNSATRVIVTIDADHVWQNREKTLPVCDVVPGCVLKKMDADHGFIRVQLADGREGYIAETSVTDLTEWNKSRKPTADNIEKTAKSLLGVPYLWGGTSTKMLDCSGFTKTVFYLNGIELLRNASHQVHQGTPIEAGKNFENLRKGDLIFFGNRRDGTLKIRHVGIYLQDGLFIHSSGLVHISSLYKDSDLRDDARIASFIAARRVLPQ
ncbi:MAG: glycoside hydrolase [Verrucomicrobiales bacterium]|nr:glycoside hydrolase [Verrucomicrobiales bacterium]